MQLPESIMDTMTSMGKMNGNSDLKGIADRFTAAVNVIRSLPKNGKYFGFIVFFFVGMNKRTK